MATEQDQIEKEVNNEFQIKNKISSLPGPGDMIYRFYEIMPTENGEETRLRIAIVIPNDPNQEVPGDSPH